MISGLTMAVGIDELTVDRADDDETGGSLTVHVRWRASGSALALLGGSWRVSAWSDGPGTEVQVADESAPVVATSAPSISQAMTLVVPLRAVRPARPVGQAAQAGWSERGGRLRVEVAHQNQGQPSVLRCDRSVDLHGRVA